MKEFVLIFRSSSNPHANPSPEQLQERMHWMTGITSRNKLADKGARLSARHARTVRQGNVVTDGPYTSTQEFVNGYMVVKTESIDEAVEFAKTNPILKAGGNVEVRAVLTPDDRE